MNATGNSLFRQEALQYRANRLQGNISINTPLSWQVIGILLFFILTLSFVFLAAASYSRSETVNGEITLDRGVASIIPSRPGTILELKVFEGQQVKLGQKLAVIRAEESMIAGASAPTRVRSALKEQDARLVDLAQSLIDSAKADQARLKAQVDGDRVAIPLLQRQIEEQRRLIAAAEADYNIAIDVAKRGYITKRDMDERQALIITRRQQLLELEQALAAKISDITQTLNAIRRTELAANAQVASTKSDQAALSREQAEADLASGYAVTAPLDGTVTAVTGRLGQSVSVNQQLMAIVPARAKLRVELYVPTTAAGFLAVGQDVRLSIDSYPYQTYGTITGRISSISKTTVTRSAANGAYPAYLVTATLGDSGILAFGERRQLLPGMTLSARIITDKRSLLKWVFEPLFAVSRR